MPAPLAATVTEPSVKVHDAAAAPTPHCSAARSSRACENTLECRRILECVLNSKSRKPTVSVTRLQSYGNVVRLPDGLYTVITEYAELQLEFVAKGIGRGLATVYTEYHFPVFRVEDSSVSLLIQKYILHSCWAHDCLCSQLPDYGPSRSRIEGTDLDEACCLRKSVGSSIHLFVCFLVVTAGQSRD